MVYTIRYCEASTSVRDLSVIVSVCSGRCKTTSKKRGYARWEAVGVNQETGAQVDFGIPESRQLNHQLESVKIHDVLYWRVHLFTTPSIQVEYQESGSLG